MQKSTFLDSLRQTNKSELTFLSQINTPSVLTVDRTPIQKAFLDRVRTKILCWIRIWRRNSYLSQQFPSKTSFPSFLLKEPRETLNKRLNGHRKVTSFLNQCQKVNGLRKWTVTKSKSGRFKGEFSWIVHFRTFWPSSLIPWTVHFYSFRSTFILLDLPVNTYCT